MDDPALDRDLHVAALHGLERINRASGTARRLWAMIRPDARASRQPLRILDVATGAGDVPRQLQRLASRDGLPLHITACDVSDVAVAHARRRTSDVSYRVADALADDLPDADVATCCLFLHHLDDDAAIGLLARLATVARRVIVDDLERSRCGYALAWLGTRALSRSEVVRADGPLSVRAALTVPEATRLAERAGLAGASIRRHWPCRFTLDWRRP